MPDGDRASLDHARIVRICLGLYVAVHFAALLPDATEVFSNRGMLAERTLSPLLGVFPNVFAIWDGPWVIRCAVTLAAAAGVCITAGKCVRPAAGLALYVSACLFGRNPLIGNPAMPYVGLLLLATALGGLRNRGRAWAPEMFRALWIVMALGYTYSGVTKLVSLSWVDGRGLAYILANPLAREGFARTWLLSASPTLLRCLTWGALLTELATAPLALSSRARPWLWTALTALQLGLLVLVDFADLTVGMLVLHVAVFDPRWLRAAEPPCDSHDGASPIRSTDLAAQPKA